MCYTCLSFCFLPFPPFLFSFSVVLHRLLIAYQRLDQHPVLWGLLSLVSRGYFASFLLDLYSFVTLNLSPADSRGMEVCGGLVHLLLSMLISYWQKNKGCPSRDHPTQLYSSEMIVQCLSRVSAHSMRVVSAMDALSLTGLFGLWAVQLAA